MIVSCPNCDTQFNVPDEIYAPGRKARCAVCSHVFPLPGIAGSPLQREGPAELKSAPKQPEAPLAGTDGNIGANPGEDKNNDADFASVLAGEGVEAQAAAPPRRSKTTKIVIAALSLFCLGGIALAASFFVGVWDRVQQSEGPVETQEVSPSDARIVPELDKVRNIIVNTSGFKYEFVRNEKLGPILVIHGRVTNNFSTPKDYITVEARILNERGAVIKSQRQVCGVLLSPLQLSALGQNELVKALNNRMEILANNVNVMPGADVPFMIVFIYPPANTKEIEVTVVDATDPPKP